LLKKKTCAIRKQGDDKTGRMVLDWKDIVLRKMLIIAGFSAVLLFAFASGRITINYWQKLLYDNIPTEKQKKRDRTKTLILWAICTVVLIIAVILFVED